MDLVPSVSGGLQVFDPLLDPLDRFAGEQRQQADKRLLVVGGHFDTKGATNVRLDNADLFLCPFQRLGQNGAQDVRSLR